MRILIIEDFKLISDMLTLSCRGLYPEALVHSVATGAEAIASFRQTRFDVVFLDLVLPDCHGLELVPQLRAVAASVRIIALTSCMDEFSLHQAMQAHIMGFVDKNNAPLDVLRDAIVAVTNGHSYFSSGAQKLKAQMRADPAAFDKLLSEREQRLMVLFGRGMDNEEIAGLTRISATGVKSHRRNIMRKLDIHSTPELIRYATEKGFIHFPVAEMKPDGV